MNLQEVLDPLDRNFNDATAQGARAVDVSALKQLVAGLRKIVAASTAQAAAEEQKRMQISFEHWLERNKQHHEWDVEMFRTVITPGQHALKSCLLINGGAAIALMAFAGHRVEQASPSIPIRLIANSMAMFVAGVLAGGLTAACTYISQWMFFHKHEKTGLGFNIASVVLGLVSLGSFCWGGYLAYSAIMG